MTNEKLTLYSIIGSLIVVVVTVIGNVIVTIISKKNEFKQAQFKTILECAWKEYEYKTNLVKELAEKEGKRPEIIPFIEYLIFYSRFVYVLNKKKVKEKDMVNFLKENRKNTEDFYKHSSKYNIQNRNYMK